MNRLFSFGLLFGVISIASVNAGDAIPLCLGKGKNLPVMNSQVHQWKTTTKNQFLARAHVHGVVAAVYPQKNGHVHFSMEMDGGVRDTLEVVYSLDFGKLPRLALGMEVEACGDYITSKAPTAQYPASPDGAIIHWIHKNPRGRGHESGYLAIDGLVYGD